jgi:hypothetical protein
MTLLPVNPAMYPTQITIAATDGTGPVVNAVACIFSLFLQETKQPLLSFLSHSTMDAAQYLAFLPIRVPRLLEIIEDSVLSSNFIRFLGRPQLYVCLFKWTIGSLPWCR